jgi:hypothetical protein
MSDILDKAKEHFKEIDRKIIDVPEWGITVYAKPLTLADKRILTRNTKPDDVTLFADVLILKAEDKEGKKLYSLEDKQTLMRSVDPEVVARVAQDILSVVPVEDWLKKIRSDNDLLNILHLAKDLNLKLSDIMDMSVNEFNLWCAFYDKLNRDSKLKK